MKIEFRLKNSKKAISQNSMKTTFLLENFEKLLTWSPENLTKEINLKRLLVGDIYKEKRTTQWNKNRAITERHYQLCSKLNSSIPITAFVSRATPTEHTNPLKLRLLHFFLPLHFSLSLCFFLSLSLSLKELRKYPLCLTVPQFDNLRVLHGWMDAFECIIYNGSISVR